PTPNQMTKSRTASSTGKARNRRRPLPALLSLLPGIAFEHLFLHRAPDFRVNFDEARRQADFGDIARARQVDRIVSDRMRHRARGKDHYPVGQRNRLLEIVRAEYHGLTVDAPQLEQLVPHPLPR